MEIVKRVDFARPLKGCSKYQECISYISEMNVYFYVVAFSRSMSCNYFHGRSGLICFEYFLDLNHDTVRAMSRTNRELQIRTSSSTRTTLNNAY